MNCFLILIALLIKGDYFVGATSKYYKTLTVEDSGTCKLVTNRKIILGGSHPGLLLEQVRLNDYTGHWKEDLYCHVTVAAPYRDRQIGVYALVQDLKFRYNTADKRCIDHIRFKSRGRDWSKMICGSTAQQAFNEDGVSDIGYVAPNGDLDVFIFVNRKALAYNESKTYVSIAFTLFQGTPCWRSYAHCGKDNGCILADLFGDGIVNCPYEGQPDETIPVDLLTPPPVTTPDVCDDCSGVGVISGENLEVTIQTVVTLVLSFALFTTCVCLCRKRRNLCWSEERSDGPPPRMQPRSVADMENRAGPLIEIPQPSAPPLEADKDLPPPPYDSLFWGPQKHLDI